MGINLYLKLNRKNYMQAFITRGCSTDHGGKIIEGEDSWLVEGRAVHLEGMTHYCPKCKILSKAIGTERGFILIQGKNPIVHGDRSSCGSKYIKISDLAGRDAGKDHTSSQLKLSQQKNGYSAQYQLINELDGTVYKNVKYKITYDDGHIVEGITDNDGMTEKLNSRDQSNQVSIETFENDSW